MKILLIDVNCKQSSTGKIVYDLYTQCNKDGHTAAICYGRGPRVDEPNIYKFSSTIEVYLHALLTRITGLTGYYSFFSTRKLIKFIASYQPDVVHIHELHAYFVNLKPVIDYLKKNNIRTIWTFHCEFMYTGKCGYAYDCEKWKNECGKCPYLRDYPSSLIFDFTKKMFNDKKKMFENFNNLTIVTPSKWLADRTKLSFLKDKKIEVIYNGIDTNIFKPKNIDYLKLKHNITDQKIIVYVTADFDNERKGGKYVLELAKRLQFENIKMFIVGNKKVLENLPKNIIMVGRTNNQDKLADYYNLADLSLITSKKETFSMICAESLSCGTPIVGFEAGAPETITIQEYSEFVKYGNMDALIQAVYRWIDKKNEVTADLAKKAAKKYSKERMYANYLKLYSNRL